MIISRIRKHLAQHDWLAVGVDIVVVIVGILVAFQIERWSEEIRNQNLEQEYLLRLQQDLETEIIRMDQALEYAERRIQAATLLDRVVTDQSIAGDLPEDLLWALETVGWRSYPVINAFVYRELQSSGNLALVRSESLRRNLADHYTTLQHYSDVGFDMETQHQFERYTAGILTMDELVAFENGQWENGSVSSSAARAFEIAGDLVQRKNAIVLLPSLVQHHTFNRRVIGEAKARAREIIVQIDALLKDP